jgi:hypothetical protein
MSDKVLPDLLRVGQIVGLVVCIDADRLRAYLDSSDCLLVPDYQRHCRLALDLREEILGSLKKKGSS